MIRMLWLASVLLVFAIALLLASQAALEDSRRETARFKASYEATLEANKKLNDEYNQLLEVNHRQCETITEYKNLLERILTAVKRQVDLTERLERTH